jgi:LmbE family N-acetylglucosaminyl deacetylase
MNKPNWPTPKSFASYSMLNSMSKPLQPKVVLAIGAHADDIDFSAACCIAQWIQAGAVVHYLIVTDGGKGSTDPHTKPAELAAVREKEQRQAADVLGIQEVHFFGYEDGALEVTMELKGRIVQLIRKLKPDTVITWDPTVKYVSELGFINHPDHCATGQATMDSVYPLARDHLSFPDQDLAPHKVQHLLLINPERPNYFVDVTHTFDAKLQALKRHTSQVASGPLFERLKEYSAHIGKMTDCTYAEGFVRIDIPA